MKIPIHHLGVLSFIMFPVIAYSQTNTPRLERFGLESESIKAIVLATAPSSKPYLYAAADETGILRRNLISPDSDWVNLGLLEKTFAALDIHVWGAGPAVFHTPVVAISPDYSQGDSTLIYRLENMQWVPSDSGIPKNLDIRIYAMSSFASSGNEPPGFAFAGGDNEFLFRSQPPRKYWEQLRGSLATDGPSILVVAIQQRDGIEELWIGGFSGLFFQPWLAKSTDFGATWQSLSFNLDLGPENGPYAVAFHPEYPNIAYVGMISAVIKTTDGGQSWQFTGLRDKPLVWQFRSVEIDPFDYDHIYAGGVNALGSSNGILWESFDAGETWTEIPYSDSWVTGIVPDPSTAGKIYFATNGDGIWKYTSPIVAIEESEATTPQAFGLEQNYPNPFAPARAESFLNTTSIHYRLLRETQVTLTIYDIIGRALNTLVQRRQGAGDYVVMWNGRDQRGEHVPSGVYFYKLTVGGFAQTRKLAVVQ